MATGKVTGGSVERGTIRPWHGRGGGRAGALLWRAVATAALAGTGLLATTGCTAYRSAQDVPVESSELAAGPISVRVQNFAGDVRIVSSSDVDRPRVAIRTRETQDIGPEPSEVIEVTASASTRVGLVLDVVVVAPAQYVDKVAADLEIVVPALVNTEVRTTAGRVDVVGGTGSATISVGGERGGGGSIVVRARDALQEDMTLATTEGDVTLVVPPGSGGELDLSSLAGRSDVRAGSTPARNVRTSAGRWTGTLGNGRNTVSMRSGKGDLAMIVIPDAEKYSPPR